MVARSLSIRLVRLNADPVRSAGAPVGDLAERDPLLASGRDLQAPDQDPLVVLVGEIDDLDRRRVPPEILERLLDIDGPLVGGVEQNRHRARRRRSRTASRAAERRSRTAQ